MTLTDYLNLVPSSNANQPDFIATLSANVNVCVQIQSVLASMIPLFDLSTPPVGDQLDIIGQWVGISRDISVPITGVFFTWDGTAALGWDSGTWVPAGGSTSLTVLPDDAYLISILGKIAANRWDGTTNSAYTIFAELFSEFTILISDFENMSYAVVIIASSIDALTQTLLTGGYILLRPEGIEITDYFISPGPVFTWDAAPTAFVAGWDTGLWATALT